MRVIFAVVLPVALLFMSCSKQQLVTRPGGLESGNVQSLQTGAVDANLFYSLPRSVVSIDMEVGKTKNIPGPYARYASRFLGLDDVISSASEKYEIKSVNISSFFEPDPDQIYYVRIPDDMLQCAYLGLTEAGLIAAINKTPGIDDMQYAYEYTKDFKKTESLASFNYFMDINLMERIDTIIRYEFEDTAVVQRQTFRRSMVEKSTEQRAREAAEHILEIREKKFDLITGFQEIPYTKDALEFMHTELSKLENDYLALFTGITSYSTMRYRFIHRPSKEDAGKQHILFHFSENDGVISNADVDMDLQNTKPVILLYQPANATKSLAQLQQQRLPTTPFTPAKGLHYRIPDYADIDILFGAEPRAKSRMLISQFGVINALPAINMEVEFYPGTGSIKSIGLDEVEIKEE